MKKALFYHSSGEKEVICDLCNHHCHIREDGLGICGVRKNKNGKLYSLVYGKLVAQSIDPIEKKPMFHVLPESMSYSIATVGCNFRCLHCQNYRISQYPCLQGGAIPGRPVNSEDVVRAAWENGCQSISYTYVEPTVFFEFAFDCCVLARERKIKNIFVSNGYMTRDVTRRLAPVLDGINIDIKAFTDSFYKKVCQARLQPVLDNVRLMRELGVWVEVTTLIIPGLNDSVDELRDIARFLKSVDSAIPWHVTAFYPTFKMMDRGRTTADTLRKAREIGLEEELRFVYEGNIPGEGGENTYCPACGMQLITRFGFSIEKNKIVDGHCPACGEKIEGIW